jgi:hypothetical protein
MPYGLLIALAFPMLSAKTNALLAKAPPQIGAFMERRAECEHWSGEEPYDGARADQIGRAEAELACDRLAPDGRALQRQYRRRPTVLRVLKREQPEG